MKSIAVILGVAVYLVLIVTEGRSMSFQAPEDKNSIERREVMEELAKLLETREDAPKPKQEQIISPQSLSLDAILEKRNSYPPKHIITGCGRHGRKCCDDDKHTRVPDDYVVKVNNPYRRPEETKKQEYCARTFCSDQAAKIDYCQYNFNRLNCNGNDFYLCPYSCSRKGFSNACKSPASPKKRCENNNPGRQCCWHGLADKNGCLPCQDLLPATCKNIGVAVCYSGSQSAREFMYEKCPKLCKLC